MGSIHNFTPLAGANNNTVKTSNSPFATFTSPDELSNISRWPDIPILSDTVNPQINSYLLINGNMNLLQGLYNSVSGICTGFVNIGSGNPTANSLRVPAPSQLQVTGTGMRVQIVPYNIDTGVAQSCITPPLYISPRGRVMNDGVPASPFTGNNAEDRKLTRPSNVRANMGFIVRVQTQYSDEYDSTSTCVTEQKFQYDGDADAPPTPTVLSSTMTSPAPAVCTAKDTNEFELEVGYNSTLGRIEPGSVLLCQDQSVIPNVTQNIPPGIATKKFACHSGNNASPPPSPDPGPQVAQFVPGSYFLPAGYSGYEYTVGTTSAGIRRWVPCNSLQLCGVPPYDVTSESADGPPRKLAYRLKYRNLPSDCRIVVKTAGIDTSANSSGELASPSMGSNNPAMFVGPSNSWDVPRPRCRVFCGYYETDGYFTCGSC